MLTNWSIVVAVDEAGGIGKNNQLLCHLPEDLQHFKRLTMGKPILMGRKTFASIGRPLPGRRNIILTHQDLSIPGIETVTSLDAAKALLQDSPEVMVIGGAVVYTEVLPWVSTLYLTRIHQTFDADVFFPELNFKDWRVEAIGRIAEKATFYRFSRLR